MLNATFINISVISWRSVLLVDETGENHWPAASHWQTLSHTMSKHAVCSKWIQNVYRLSYLNTDETKCSLYEIIIDCGLNCKKEVLYAWFAFLTRHMRFLNDGGGWNRRKPLTCRKSLTNFITYCCIEYTSPEWDSNSQR
jgi:hypothetical protein